MGLTLGISIYSWNARTLAGNAMPMPFGFGMSVVLFGSMEPTLSINDLVIVQEADSYEVGDIAVYPDGASLVIHKIISIDGDEVITKGDANNVADAPIDASLIKGKAVAHLPLAGAVIRFFKTPLGVLILILATVLFFELPYSQRRKKTELDQEKIKEEIRRLKEEVN